MKDFITYLKFDDLDEKSLLINYSNDIRDKTKVVTVTPNLDGLRLTYKDLLLRKQINNANYVTIDGKPVLWIAKLNKKKNFTHKISGSDLTIKVLEMANEQHYSLSIFGGKPGVAEKAKENIQRDYPGVKVKKTICPPLGFELRQDLTNQYIKEINSANADIVLLCTGFPKTERFFFANYEKFSSACYFCVGATVDFIAGNIKRAPKWMSRFGLEWFYRLMKDFKRLFKRYFFDFLFLIKIIFMSIFCKKKIEEMREV